MKRAFIAGAGGATGVALCRSLGERGFHVIAAARNGAQLSAELGDVAADVIEIDLASPSSVERAVASIEPVDVLVYNAGKLHLAPLVETTIEMFEESWRVNALGAFACARSIAPRMIERGRGSMVFVGATSSLRGGARTHAFASSKHALRGLARSLAKELGPRGVHVAHLVLDGKVWGARTRSRFPEVRHEQCLEADAIAATVGFLLDQPRSTWTFEMDMRPDVEKWS